MDFCSPLTSCCRSSPDSEYDEHAERDNLLDDDDDDGFTTSPETFFAKVVDVLVALKAGKIPSQDQIDGLARMGLKSDLLTLDVGMEGDVQGAGAAGAGDLSVHGKKVVLSVRELLQSILMFGLEKNYDDAIQTLYFHLSQIDDPPIAVDVNGAIAAGQDLTSAVREQVPKQADLQTVSSDLTTLLASTKSLLVLLLTSTAFRLLLSSLFSTLFASVIRGAVVELASDVGGIAQQVGVVAGGIEKAAGDVESAAGKVQEQVQVQATAEGSTLTDDVDLGGVKETVEKAVNEVKEDLNGVPADVLDVEVKPATDSNAQTAPTAEDVEDLVVTQLQEALSQASQNPEFISALQTILTLFQKYAAQLQAISNQSQALTESESRPPFLLIPSSTPPHLTAALANAQTILERLAGGRSLSGVLEAFSAVVRDGAAATNEDGAAKSTGEKSYSAVVKEAASTTDEDSATKGTTEKTFSAVVKEGAAPTDDDDTTNGITEQAPQKTTQTIGTQNDSNLTTYVASIQTLLIHLSASPSYVASDQAKVDLTALVDEGRSMYAGASEARSTSHLGHLIREMGTFVGALKGDSTTRRMWNSVDGVWVVVAEYFVEMSPGSAFAGSSLSPFSPSSPFSLFSLFSPPDATSSSESTTSPLARLASIASSLTTVYTDMQTFFIPRILRVLMKKMWHSKRGGIPVPLPRVEFAAGRAAGRVGSGGANGSAGGDANKGIEVAIDGRLGVGSTTVRKGKGKESGWLSSLGSCFGSSDPRDGAYERLEERQGLYASQDAPRDDWGNWLTPSSIRVQRYNDFTVDIRPSTSSTTSPYPASYPASASPYPSTSSATPYPDTTANLNATASSSRVTSSNKVHLQVKDLFASPSGVDRTLRLHGIRYYAKYAAGYRGLIGYEDEGVVDLDMDLDWSQEGVTLDIDFELDAQPQLDEPPPPTQPTHPITGTSGQEVKDEPVIFRISSVNLTLPETLEFDARIHDSRHWILNSLVVQPVVMPLAKAVVRREMKGMLEGWIKEGLEASGRFTNRVVVGARKRRAVRGVGEVPALGDWVNAILDAATETSEQEKEAVKAKAKELEERNAQTQTETTVTMTGVQIHTEATEVHEGDDTAVESVIAIGATPQLFPSKARPPSAAAAIDELAAEVRHTAEDAVEGAMEDARAVVDETVRGAVGVAQHAQGLVEIAGERWNEREAVEASGDGWRSEAFDL